MPQIFVNSLSHQPMVLLLGSRNDMREVLFSSVESQQAHGCRQQSHHKRWNCQIVFVLVVEVEHIAGY